MSERPTVSEIRWESFTEFGQAIFQNVLWLMVSTIIVFLVLLLLNAFFGKKKNKKYGILPLAVILLWMCSIVWLNVVHLGAYYQQGTTTEKEDFFDYEANANWYNENFSKVYKSTTEEEYEILDLQAVQKIDGAEFETDGTVYSKPLKGEVREVEEKELSIKQRKAYEELRKEFDETAIFYVSATVKNEKDEIRNLEAIVNVKYNERFPKGRALLKDTEQVKGDPGENIYYGKLEIQENIFK